MHSKVLPTSNCFMLKSEMLYQICMAFKDPAHHILTDLYRYILCSKSDRDLY